MWVQKCERVEKKGKEWLGGGEGEEGKSERSE